LPWKEVRLVDARVRFIAEVNDSEETFAALCRKYGISRKTGYKWCERYEELGLAGLDTRAPVARTCPHKTDDALVTLLVALRKDHPSWGPKKLKARLEAEGSSDVPAASTIGELLKRYGLVRPRRRRVYPPSMTPQPLAEATAPNDTWCVDFKGHFALGDKTRCYPLTLSDQVSRYLLKCESVDKPDVQHVRPHFERAFREFGLPLRIRSDNGPPFATTGIGGLSELSVWWIKLGIAPERIEPGKPQQNGRHERMHRTLKQEVASKPEANRQAQQLSFDRFRHEYNDVRPHEALAMATPSARYTTSRRVMPASLSSPQYPSTMEVRRVKHAGGMSWQGVEVHLTPLLSGEPVGVEPLDEQRWRLHYGPVVLAELTMRGKELRLDKQR
jgi:transposase InsO family protein